MSGTATEETATLAAPDLEALAEVERRILWLAVRMVDHANTTARTPTGSRWVAIRRPAPAW